MNQKNHGLLGRLNSLMEISWHHLGGESTVLKLVESKPNSQMNGKKHLNDHYLRVKCVNLSHQNAGLDQLALFRKCFLVEFGGKHSNIQNVFAGVECNVGRR